MKVRLGKISFANCHPVYYGLNNGLRPPWLDLTPAPPTVLNGMLENSELEISPVSSVAYAKHAEDWLIIPSISIASRGEVLSVILVSTLPLGSLGGKKVITTTDSETSVELLKLCLEREGARPVFERGMVKDTTNLGQYAAAALLIGDPALQRRRHDLRGQCVTDLGRYWHDWTGLPFVYAVWAVRRAFAEKNPQVVKEVAVLLKQSLSQGITHIDTIARSASLGLELEEPFVRTYFRHLHYQLDQEEVAGLCRFFDQLHDRGILRQKVTPRFFPC
jgi:chorismate dehydratase